MHKTLTALAVAAAMTFAVVAAPDQAEARWRGRNVGAGILGGIATGLIIGAMAANSGYYYGSGYEYGPGYYGPGYYGPGPFAYEPAPIYVVPAPVYVVPPRSSYSGGCWIVTDDARGFGHYGPCR